MAEQNNNVDDLGIPKRSRAQIWEWLREHDPTISATAMPLLNSEYSIDQHNIALTRAIGTVIPNVRRHFSYKPIEKDSRIYALTLTSQVIDGIALRGYPEFMVTLRRLKDLPGVFKVQGWFELTKQNALHVHALVHTSKYVEKKKVTSYNGGHFIKMELVNQKTPTHLVKCTKYMTKTLDEPTCLAVIKASNPRITSTYVEL